MDLQAINQAIAGSLSSILRAYPYPSEQISPPCAVVAVPERVSYSNTMGSLGAVHITIPLFVFVGTVSDRSALNSLGPYINSSGTKSIKAAIESSAGLGAVINSVNVSEATISATTIASVDYLCATFQLDIYTT